MIVMMMKLLFECTKFTKPNGSGPNKEKERHQFQMDSRLRRTKDAKIIKLINSNFQPNLIGIQ